MAYQRFNKGEHALIKRHLVCLFVCCTWLVCSLSGQASAEQCMPVKVVDGDTIHFMRGTELVKVRIAGFDAPERGQAFGRVATTAMRDLVQGGADCDCYKLDRYGRSVCRVRVNGQNVAAKMLKTGLGCIDPRFVSEDSQNDQAANAEALRYAQAAHLGMWSDAAPMCGKEFRDLKHAKRH